ncbi:MAG: NUDIX domain-containing protein [Chloroflexi bacterium]|nr:NUDIX domain-containing protein [Chloroflexota bacterium]
MKYRFCPACGGALATRPVPQDEHERLVCQGCGLVFYQNSKPCVGALVVREDGRLLLVRRNIEPFKGAWDLPGGFLELGEHPDAGVVREVQEETGLTIRPRDLLGIYMDWYGPEGDATLNLMYLVEIVGGDARPASDAEAIGWFGPDELPEHIAFTCNRQALADWRKRFP